MLTRGFLGLGGDQVEGLGGLRLYCCLASIRGLLVPQDAST